MSNKKFKEPFGELSSKDFRIGDIVEWSKWDSEKESFSASYGILLELKNKVTSNRIVSIATVMSLGDDKTEREFFTLSLKLISRKKEKVEVDL
jgi:hypothetical protein